MKVYRLEYGSAYEGAYGQTLFKDRPTMEQIYEHIDNEWVERIKHDPSLNDDNFYVAIDSNYYISLDIVEVF